MQVITLQEAPGSVLPGRMPRSVEVILSDDLVDSVRPGDQCSIVGTYHARSDTSSPVTSIIIPIRYDSAGNVRAGFPVFKCAIDANSIVRQNEMKIESVRDEDKREYIHYSPLDTVTVAIQNIRVIEGSPCQGANHCFNCPICLWYTPCYQHILHT